MTLSLCKTNRYHLSWSCDSINASMIMRLIKYLQQQMHLQMLLDQLNISDKITSKITNEKLTICMKNINQTTSKQIHHLLSSYQNILQIHYIKDFKRLKPVQNLQNYSQHYLRSTVQKLLLLTQQPCEKHKLFISQKPYLKPSGKLVYLFSYNNTFGKLLTEYDPQMVGANVIAILKTIYNDIFAEDQSPPKDFQAIVEYVIDHQEQLNHNHKKPHEIRKTLQSFSFIIKNNLSLRVQKSFSLSQLLQKLQSTYFHQLIIDSLKAFSLSSDQTYKNEMKLFYLCKFLSICTKNAVIIYPAKRTIDSKAKIDTFQSQEHFVVNVHTKQTPKSFFKRITQQDDGFINNKTLEMSEIMFSFTKIPENNPECLLIQLKSDFKISGPCFVLFEQFYESILSRYEFLYLNQPFQSAFESNMSKIRPYLNKKQSKISFNYKISINNRQSIIIEFIKCVDMLIMMYLVLEEFLMKMQNQKFIQRLESSKAQGKYLQEEMSQNLYIEVKGYLEKLTTFKRNVLLPNYG